METIMWHNLHRILVHIRFDIRNCSNKNNCYVIDAILDSFYKKLGNEELCAAILKRMPEWETHLLLYNEKRIYRQSSRIRIIFYKSARIDTRNLSVAK